MSEIKKKFQLKQHFLSLRLFFPTIVNEAVCEGNSSSVLVCASSSAALTLVQLSECCWRDATPRALWVIH